MRLTEAEARQLLAAERVARLATAGGGQTSPGTPTLGSQAPGGSQALGGQALGGSGQPHIVPVTFAVDGDRIWMAVDHKPKTTVNLRRLRNIRDNPRVALLADHYEEDWDRLWWVRADGRARIVEDGPEREHALDILTAKYRQYRRTRPAGPVIVIDAERWTGWTSRPGARESPLSVPYKRFGVGVGGRDVRRGRGKGSSPRRRAGGRRSASAAPGSA